jgi:hypothetical protein
MSHSDVRRGKADFPPSTYIHSEGSRLRYELREGVFARAYGTIRSSHRPLGKPASSILHHACMHVGEEEGQRPGLAACLPAVKPKTPSPKCGSAKVLN